MGRHAAVPAHAPQEPKDPIPDLPGPRTPLLLVDVDGVLSLYGGAAEGLVGALVDGVPHWLSRRAAAALVAAAPHFECVWCTGWKERADEHLPHLLGLPRGWPHILFPKGEAKHWKLPGIDAYAGPDRALAWIDDAHDAHCREWAQRRTGPTLLISVEPAEGLLPEHAVVLREWALSLTAASSRA
jgi:hypothetical protein